MCHPVAESALAFRVTVLLGVGWGTPGCQPGLTGRVLGVCVAVRGKTALGPERSLVLSLAWCAPSWLCSLAHRAPPEPTSHPAQGALVAFATFQWHSERLAPSAVCRRAPPLDLGSPGSPQARAHAAAAGG